MKNKKYKINKMFITFTALIMSVSFMNSNIAAEVTTYGKLSDRNKVIVNLVGRGNDDLEWNNEMYDSGSFRHFARYNYYGSKKPIGIMIHEVANDSSTLQDELNFQQRRQDGIFAHAYIDQNYVSQTADFNKMAQAGGMYANPYYLQVEIVRGPEGIRTRDDFDNSMANTAKWAAQMLIEFDINEVTLADNNKGEGTIISHSAVANYLGGTTHTDPIDWFEYNDYNMDQLVELIKYYKDSYEGPEYGEVIVKHTAYGLELDEEVIEGVVGESFETQLNKKDYDEYKFKEVIYHDGAEFKSGFDTIVEIRYEGIYKDDMNLNDPAYRHPAIKAIKDLQKDK